MKLFSRSLYLFLIIFFLTGSLTSCSSKENRAVQITIKNFVNALSSEDFSEVLNTVEQNQAEAVRKMYSDHENPFHELTDPFPYLYDFIPENTEKKYKIEISIDKIIYSKDRQIAFAYCTFTIKTVGEKGSDMSDYIVELEKSDDKYYIVNITVSES